MQTMQTTLTSLHTLATLLLIGSLTACSTLVRTPGTAGLAGTDGAIAAYARALDKYVNANGEVDFVALRDDSSDLDRYVAFIANTPATRFSNANDRLAHYINSYNALSMYNVLESGIPRTHAGLSKLKFFVLRKLTIGGETRSLYSYENDVIRKLGDPRVHFALNCSAVSCPTLPRVPFTGVNIDAELDRETRKFFADSKHFRLDRATHKAKVSEILKFYREDFTPAHAPSLIEYVNRYSPAPIPEGYGIEFLEYDWTVANSRRPKL